MAAIAAHRFKPSTCAGLGWVGLDWIGLGCVVLCFGFGFGFGFGFWLWLLAFGFGFGFVFVFGFGTADARLVLSPLLGLVHCLVFVWSLLSVPPFPFLVCLAIGLWLC